MKALTSLALPFMATVCIGQTINQSGFSFSPDLLTVDVGTTVTFVIGSPHDATQVSETTWNAGGSTPLPGGFSFGAGTHQFTPTLPGTYYYLCTVHSFSMKGRIVAESGTGVGEAERSSLFMVFPNPASDELSIPLDKAGRGVAVLFNQQGREALRSTVPANGQLDVSSLPSGHYLLRVLDQDGAASRDARIVIAR